MENAAQAVTTGRPGSLNQNHLKSGTKDRARERPLVRMTVHNRNTLVLALPGANLIDIGTHTITCYDDEADAIREMVEDPRKIAQAETQHAIDLAEKVAKHLDPPWARGIEELHGIIASKADGAINAVHARIVQTTGLSRESAFQKLFKRSMKPLSMAELVPNSEHAEPQRAGTQREVEKQADAFALALDRVLSKYSQAISPEQIQAMVDERLEQQLGGKGGKR